MDKLQPGGVQRDVVARLANLLEIVADDNSEWGDEAVLVDDLLLDMATVITAPGSAGSLGGGRGSSVGTQAGRPWPHLVSAERRRLHRVKRTTAAAQ